MCVFVVKTLRKEILERLPLKIHPPSVTLLYLIYWYYCSALSYTPWIDKIHGGTFDFMLFLSSSLARVCPTFDLLCEENTLKGSARVIIIIIIIIKR